MRAIGVTEVQTCALPISRAGRGYRTPPGSLGVVFETLSDRLTQVFSSLRGRGKLTAADIDATAREIRIALLEADVALPEIGRASCRENGSDPQGRAARSP